LEKFILEQGASKNLNNMDMSKLWAVNREIIDPIVPRFTAIAKENM
jgi:glutamyl-tRNA synthetase